MRNEPLIRVVEENRATVAKLQQRINDLENQVVVLEHEKRDLKAKADQYFLALDAEQKHVEMLEARVAELEDVLAELSQQTIPNSDEHRLIMYALNRTPA